MASGEFDLWNGRPSSQRAFVRINPEGIPEEEVDFFQDGTGAAIAHFWVMTQDDETLFYEIVEVEWTNQDELTENRSDLVKDFDGETVVETNSLTLDGTSFESHLLGGKVLQYPAALGEITLSDVKTLHGSDHYVYGDIPFQNSEKIDWHFFYSMGDPYFVFSVPNKDHSTVYVLENGLVSPVLTLTDDENWFSYFLITIPIELQNGESQIFGYLYHFPEGEIGQPEEHYILHLKDFLVVNSNSESFSNCYGEVVISDDENEWALRVVNREDCESGSGIYINGEKIAESFMPSYDETPYLRETYLSPSLQNIAFVLQLLDAPDYIMDWNWKDGTWNAFEVVYTDTENDTWNYPVAWQEQQDGTYELVQEQEGYKLREL